MISREQFESARQQAREYLARAGIVITPEEAKNIEVADFGLNELDSTGLELVVLSDEEEARLAFQGAAGTLGADAPEPLGVLDVGGGSSEVVVGRAPDRIDWWRSMPIGSGSIARAHLHSDPPTESELDAARSAIAGALDMLRPPPVAGAVAVGGSATSLGRIAGPTLDVSSLVRSLGAALRVGSSLTGTRPARSGAMRSNCVPSSSATRASPSPLAASMAAMGTEGRSKGISSTPSDRSTSSAAVLLARVARRNSAASGPAGISPSKSARR